MHDGLERSFNVYVPDGLDSSEKNPLVFNYHGFTSNAAQQELYSSMNSTADQYGFIVVYPEGVGAAWNVGWLFGSQEDDVGFTEAMIDYMASNFNSDRTRTYACGMSNGGFFSYLLACEIPEKIAAIASVTGSMVPGQFDTCNPNLRTPILQIHGTQDPTVSYNGTFGINEGIEDVIDFWVGINECDNTDVTITDVPDTNTSDESTAEIHQYNDCVSPGDVKFIKIENGEHTWPGASVTIGVTNRDINGSEEVWLFFEKYSRQQTVNNKNIIVEKLAIFPNPSSQSTLNISDTDRFDYIEILDQQGKLIYRQTLNNTNQVNIPNHTSSGLYIVKAYGNEKIASAKWLYL